MVIYIQISILTHIFITISKDLQWVMAILVPLIKNFDDSISIRIICKASSPDTIASKSVAKIYSGINFSLWIVIMLGTAATDFTSYCILGVNVLINMHLCLEIIHLNRRTSLLSQEELKLRVDKKEVLTELILNEVIEIIVPFAFICSFAIAYYGPNAGILGNIGNDYWTFRKVNDIRPLVKSALTMSLIDFLSALITMFALWKYCRINAIQQCCKVFKKYWQILAIHAAMNINKVNLELSNILNSFLSLKHRFCISTLTFPDLYIIFQFYTSLMIANGFDLTYKFAWIKNDDARNEMLYPNCTMSNNTTRT